MNDHDCIKREDIASLQTSVDRINKELFNGDGIIKQVPVLSYQVTELTLAVRDLRTAISGLNIFKDETTGSQKVFKNAVPWIAVIIASLTLAFSVYNNSRVSNVKENQELIDYRMQFKQDKEISPVTRSLFAQPDTAGEDTNKIIK